MDYITATANAYRAGDETRMRRGSENPRVVLTKIRYASVWKGSLVLYSGKSQVRHSGEDRRVSGEVRVETEEEVLVLMCACAGHVLFFSGSQCCTLRLLT